jgi:hypothetical protein
MVHGRWSIVCERAVESLQEHSPDCMNSIGSKMQARAEAAKGNPRKGRKSRRPIVDGLVGCRHSLGELCDISWRSLRETCISANEAILQQ